MNWDFFKGEKNYDFFFNKSKQHLSEETQFYDLFQRDGQQCSYINHCHGSNFMVTFNLKVTSADSVNSKNKCRRREA